MLKNIHEKKNIYMFQKMSCLSCIKLSNFDLKINGEKKFTVNNIYIFYYYLCNFWKELC